MRGGVKSPVLTEAAEGEAMQILEEMENWSKVRTSSGYVGYIQNRLLEQSQSHHFVSSFQAPEYTSISLGKPVCLASGIFPAGE